MSTPSHVVSDRGWAAAVPKKLAQAGLFGKSLFSCCCLDFSLFLCVILTKSAFRRNGQKVSYFQKRVWYSLQKLRMKKCKTEKKLESIIMSILDISHCLYNLYTYINRCLDNLVFVYRFIQRSAQKWNVIFYEDQNLQSAMMQLPT